MALAFAGGSARSRSAGSSAVTLVALCSLFIIRAPYLSTFTTTRGFLALLPFIASIAWLLCQRQHHADRRLLLLVTACLLFFLVDLYRGKLAGVGIGGTQEILVQFGTVVVVSAFGVLLLTTAHDAPTKWRRLVAVALAPAFFITISVLLRFAGFSSGEVDRNDISYAAGTPAKTLALIGIHVTREAFPMNPSINGTGVVAAVGLVMAATLALNAVGRDRHLGLFGAGMCLVALLLADTRAALILSVAIVGFLALVKRPRIALLIGLFIPFSAWLVTSALSVLSNTGLASAVARGAKDVSTGNGRTLIWTATKHELATSDPFHLLFGWGANGQASSGTSHGYAHAFELVYRPLLVHVHNFGLQTILDMGIVGLAVFVATIVLALRRLEVINRISPRGPVPAIIGGLVAVMLTGATEPSPTYRTQETLILVFLLLGVATGLAKQPVEIPAAESPRLVPAKVRTPIPPSVLSTASMQGRASATQE